MTMFSCTKIFPEVPFAHRAPKHEGHCRLVHGHNWKLVLEFTSTERDENGFVFDFGKLGGVKALLGEFDHALVLNDNDPDLEFYKAGHMAGRWALITVPDCSCEGLAKYLGTEADRLVQYRSNGRARVSVATLYEDEKNFATWRNPK